MAARVDEDRSSRLDESNLLAGDRADRFIGCGLVVPVLLDTVLTHN